MQDIQSRRFFAKVLYLCYVLNFPVLRKIICDCVIKVTVIKDSCNLCPLREFYGFSIMFNKKVSKKIMI